MSGRIIVSCCYSESSGERKAYYARFADRLAQSVAKFGGPVTLQIWRESWPPGSPAHNDHHYAFKWFAMNDAVQRGHRYIMWLDAGSVAIAPMEPLWKRVETDGYVLLRGADCLAHWIGDHALKHFGVTRDKAAELKLMGGCLVGLDMQHPTARRFFEWWGELAKTTRLFQCSVTAQARVDGVLRSVQATDSGGQNIISTDESVKGHRSDEACFSLMMDSLGMHGISLTEWRETMRTY